MGAGISNEKLNNAQQIISETTQVVRELLSVARLEKGDILVVGCSSSEVANCSIGTFSSEEIGKVIFDTIHEIVKAEGIYLAAQCCEHLNRALIIEKEAAKEYRLPIEAENFAEYGEGVLEDLKKAVESGVFPGMSLELPNYEGVRVNVSEEAGNGWFLLRKSLHEPLLPMNIESDTEGGAEEIKTAVYAFLEKYDKLKLV